MGEAAASLAPWTVSIGAPSDGSGLVGFKEEVESRRGGPQDLVVVALPLLCARQMFNVSVWTLRYTCLGLVLISPPRAAPSMHVTP